MDIDVGRLNDAILKTDRNSRTTPTPFWLAHIALSLIAFAFVLYSSLRMPGSIEACSSVRDDPCLFPPELYLVYPSVIAMTLGIILVAVDRGCRAAGLLALISRSRTAAVGRTQCD